VRYLLYDWMNIVVGLSDRRYCSRVSCFSTTLARAFTILGLLDTLHYWGGLERWRCRARTKIQPTADFSFKGLCATLEEFAVFFWGVWCVVRRSRTHSLAGASEVVRGRGTHLDALSALGEGWRWSHFGDSVVELCGVDVGAELVEDWVPFWVGDLGEWGFLQLVSDGLVGGGWEANSCFLPPSSVNPW
jgi:hypothetical protein